MLLLGSGCASTGGRLATSEARAIVAPAPAHAAAYQELFSSSLLDDLDALERRTGYADRTYFQGGIWRGNTTCWRCEETPGMLAAVLSHTRPDDTRLRQLAISTFDTMLRLHASPDGSFGPPARGEANKQISTFSAGICLATSYLTLDRWLTPSVRVRWKDAVHAAATWLLPSLGFYVNGNINLGETTFEYLAYRVTGDRALLAAYEQSFGFTLSPPGQRRRGFVLRYTRVPTRPDGSDGSGYLAEAGKRIGFDRYYTYIQVDHAALLYAISRSQAALRLLNLLTNELLKQTNRHSWLISIGGGTRRGLPGAQIPFVTPVIDVAVLAGGRRDLAKYVLPQFRRARMEFAADVRGTSQEEVVAEYATALIALWGGS
jgi:hypothetical protein